MQTAESPGSSPTSGMEDGKPSVKGGGVGGGQGGKQGLLRGGGGVKGGLWEGQAQRAHGERCPPAAGSHRGLYAEARPHQASHPPERSRLALPPARGAS